MCGMIGAIGAVHVAPIHGPLMRAKAKRGIYERAGWMKLKAGDGRGRRRRRRLFKAIHDRPTDDCM